MPPTDVSTMVTPPTSSDTRAPYTTRLHTSRPNSSVPRKFVPLGGFSRLTGSSRVGSWVATRPAASAAASMSTKIAVPTTTLGLRRSRLPIADPRIDEDVEHVDHEVDEHVRGGGDEDDALHDGVVAAQDRRDDQAAEAGDVEDDLGDDRSADQDGGGDPDHGDHRHHRVAEAVSDD